MNGINPKIVFAVAYAVIFFAMAVVHMVKENRG